jgi:nucleoside-diphosphate-sugar epimerase
VVVHGHTEPDRLPPDVPAKPYEVYGLTKYLGEEICRFYARQHGMSVVALRIATPVDLEDESLKEKGIRPQQLAFPDLARAFRLAVEVPDIDFEILHIVGKTTQQRWDLSRAKEVLGYEPEYGFEEMGYKFNEWHNLGVMPDPHKA